jgi:hypothetical protein
MNEEAAEQIVDRLKDEGDLIRNSGTNSIRSVKIQLDRFEDIFNVISENLITQTAMLAKSLDIQSGEFELAKETATKEETAKQFEDLEAKQDQIELKKPESKKDKEKEGKGLFSLLSGMGIGKLLMGGALIGGGLFVAYNLAKGFVDEMYGNAWTNFEEGLVSTIQSIDFEAIKNAFSNILTGLISVVGAIAALRLTLLSIRTSIAAAQLADLLRGRPSATPSAAATPRTTPGAAAAPRAAPPRDPRTGRFVSPSAAPATSTGFFSRVLNSPLTKFAGRATLPIGLGLLLNNMIQLGLRGPASEEEMQELRESGAFESFDYLGAQTPEYQPPTEEPQLTSLEEASERLQSLRTQREQMFSDARDREAESSVYIEPNTSKIDEAIRNIEDEIRTLEMEFRSPTDEDQSSLNVPFEVRPVSVSGQSASDVAESLLAHIVEAAEVGRISSAAERVAAAADGAVAMIVVNNTPVVNAPVTNVRGGPSIHNSTYFGGGGGSPMNPYGLTSAVS